MVVARPTRWGNPFAVCEAGMVDRAEAVRRHRELIACDDALVHAARVQLRGRNLACWCPLDAPCHADALLEIANG